jgi:hypothetical protein
MDDIQDMQFRLECLDKAVRAMSPGSHDTKMIVQAAEAFYAFLKGKTAPAKRK